MMSDLISRGALLAEYDKHHVGAPGGARKLIEDAPTIDAVNVVHGRWKYYHKQNIAVCTNCSFERDLKANFGKAICCPNCGAKMDGDADV